MNARAKDVPTGMDPEYKRVFAAEMVATIHAQGLEEEVLRQLTEDAKDGLTLIEALDDMFREMRRPRLVLSNAAGFDLFDPGHPGFVYEIDLDPIGSARSALFWVRQLGNKNWVSKTTLVDFANAAIELIDRRNGIGIVT